MRWQDMPEGKEKYAAYLCSREWSVLKMAVHHRSEGMCERCRRNEIDAVHHLTYARKYNESLEDLQGICDACHDFVHGRSDYDPLPKVAKFKTDRGRLFIDADGVLFEFDLSVGVAMICGTVTSHEFHKRIVEAEEIAKEVRYEREAAKDGQ